MFSVLRCSLGRSQARPDLGSMFDACVEASLIGLPVPNATVGNATSRAEVRVPHPCGRVSFASRSVVPGVVFYHLRCLIIIASPSPSVPPMCSSFPFTTRCLPQLCLQLLLQNQPFPPPAPPPYPPTPPPYPPKSAAAYPPPPRPSPPYPSPPYPPAAYPPPPYPPSPPYTSTPPSYPPPSYPPPSTTPPYPPPLYPSVPSSPPPFPPAPSPPSPPLPPPTLPWIAPPLTNYTLNSFAQVSAFRH